MPICRNTPSEPQGNIICSTSSIRLKPQHKTPGVATATRIRPSIRAEREWERNMKDCKCSIRLFALILAAAIAVCLVLVPVKAYAWGPSRNTYTIQNPAPENTFNSIIDNPNYGDERNFLRIRDQNSSYWNNESRNGWTDTMEVLPGHTYSVKLYVNNAAADNLNLVAHDVRAHISLPIKENTFGYAFEVNGYLYSSNSTPNEIWDNIVLKGKQPFHVQVLDRKYYNNYRTEYVGGFDLGEDVVSSKGTGTGALLGYKSMDGNIRGTYAESGYVILTFKPVFQATSIPQFYLWKLLDWANTRMDRLTRQWENR